VTGNTGYDGTTRRRVSVDARRLWSGGLATAFVAALVIAIIWLRRLGGEAGSDEQSSDEDESSRSGTV